MLLHQGEGKGKKSTEAPRWPRALIIISVSLHVLALALSSAALYVSLRQDPRTFSLAPKELPLQSGKYS